VLLVEYQKEIETLTPEAANQPFAHHICIWGMDWSFEYFNAGIRDHSFPGANYNLEVRVWILNEQT
jgi:hypothetical protein